MGGVNKHHQWKIAKFLLLRWSLLVKINNILKFDPLEAMKTFKGRKYGPYSEMSGTDPSSLTSL